MEEVETPDITVDLSNKDTNLNMDEGMYNDDSTVISTIKTSIIDTNTIKTSTVKTSTSLPPPSSPITTSIHVSAVSPTFFGIMQQPIAAFIFIWIH